MEPLHARPVTVPVDGREASLVPPVACGCSVLSLEGLVPRTNLEGGMGGEVGGGGEGGLGGGVKGGCVEE